MLNDPYVTLDLHYARVASLTIEARAARRARKLRHHETSTANDGHGRAVPRRLLRFGLGS